MYLPYEPFLSSGFPTRSDTNRAVQSPKMARGLKFWMWEVEGLYYLCSENKGADQLRGHREADLRLCFRICKMPVFSQEAHIWAWWLSWLCDLGHLYTQRVSDRGYLYTCTQRPG